MKDATKVAMVINCRGVPVPECHTVVSSCCPFMGKSFPLYHVCRCTVYMKNQSQVRIDHKGGGVNEIYLQCLGRMSAKKGCINMGGGLWKHFASWWGSTKYSSEKEGGLGKKFQFLKILTHPPSDNKWKVPYTSVIWPQFLTGTLHLTQIKNILQVQGYMIS